LLHSIDQPLTPVKSTQTGICIQVKKNKALDTVKENTLIVTEVIILVIGSKEKWKVKGNCMIVKEIFNMRENGKTITFRVEENYSIFQEIGWNIRDNFKQEENKVSDNCFLKMEINIKDSSETIFLGEKGGCLNKTDK